MNVKCIYTHSCHLEILRVLGMVQNVAEQNAQEVRSYAEIGHWIEIGQIIQQMDHHRPSKRKENVFLGTKKEIYRKP